MVLASNFKCPQVCPSLLPDLPTIHIMNAELGPVRSRAVSSFFLEDYIMLQARESFDATTKMESPLAQAAIEAYVPESRTAFANTVSLKPYQSERMGDEALNSFFKTNLDCSHLYKPGDKSAANHGDKTDAFAEFDNGLDHYSRSAKSLGDALKALDSNDPEAAIKDLKQSKRELNRGSNDLKDGMQLHEGKEGECPIKKGVRKANNNEFAIETAIDLIKGGCPEAAKQVIQDSVKRLDGARQQVETGVDDLRPKSDTLQPPRPETPHCPDRPEPQPKQPEHPHCPGDQNLPNRPGDTRPTRPGDTSQTRPGDSSEQPCDGSHRPGDNNSQLPGDSTAGRIIICPFENQPKPPIQKGEFLIVLVNVSRDSLSGVNNFVNRLFGGNDNSSGSRQTPDNSFGSFLPMPGDFISGLLGSNGRGDSHQGGQNGFNPMNPFSLLENLPTPPNPSDLISSLPTNPLELVKNLPNPADGLKLLDKLPNPIDPFGLFGGDKGGSGIPMPQEILKDAVSNPLSLATKPLELATKPLELATKPLELATKPLDGIKKLFKKLF
jgi:hypothetical protein